MKGHAGLSSHTEQGALHGVAVQAAETHSLNQSIFPHL